MLNPVSPKNKTERLWLPPVKQQGISRSISAPSGLRGLAEPVNTKWKVKAHSFLTEIKASDRVLSVKAASLMKSLDRTHVQTEISRAMADGDLVALRKILRYAEGRGQLISDPDVRQGQSAFLRMERCLRECRLGLQEGDMLRLQHALRDVNNSGFGKDIYRDPLLAQARERYGTWVPYRSYLLSLDEAVQAKKVRKYIRKWLEIVDAQHLSPEWLHVSALKLAEFGDENEAQNDHVGATLEEILNEPHLCWFYPRGSWGERGRLQAMVTKRLSELNFEVQRISLRPARLAQAGGEGEGGGVYMIAEGSVEVLRQLRTYLDEHPTEPVAQGMEASPSSVDSSHLPRALFRRAQREREEDHRRAEFAGAVGSVPHDGRLWYAAGLPSIPKASTLHGGTRLESPPAAS